MIAVSNCLEFIAIADRFPEGEADMSDHQSSSGETHTGKTDTEPVIELTEVAESADRAGDDAIIDLTETVDDADDAIELTEVVQPTPKPGDEDTAPALDTGAETAGPEANDAAPDEETSLADDAAGELDFGDMTFPDMELAASPGDPQTDSLTMSLEAGIMPTTEDSEELDFNLSSTELSEAIDQFDAGDADRSPAVFEPLVSTLDEAITLEVIEAAVERVIRQRFADKIDQLIEAAIERTVTSEIDRLKKRLLGGGDQTG